MRFKKNLPEEKCVGPICSKGGCNGIHWINLYPANSTIIGFPDAYLLGSDLSDEKRYPMFEQPRADP